MAKVASLSRHGQFKLIGHPVDGLNERLPAVQSGLIAHFPFDGITKPTPLVTVTADQLIGVRHATYADLIKPSQPTEFTVPGLTGTRWAVVEFDMYLPSPHPGASMVMGFLTVAGGQHIDVYQPDGSRITLNAWASQTWGAAVGFDKRVRVTVVLNTQDSVNSRVYADGVLLPMSGTQLTGIRSIQSDRILVGNGSPTNTTYLCKFYIGNLSIYKLDTGALEESNLVIPDEATGVYVGPPVTNLGYSSAGVPVVVVQQNVAGHTITNLGGGKWRVKGNGVSSASNIRLLWPTGILVNAETYTTSFRCKVISGVPLTISDFCDQPMTNRKTLVFQDHELVSASGSHATYDNTYRFTDLNLNPDSEVEIWDIQLVKGYHAPGFTDTPKLGFGSLSGIYPLPTDHTLAATQRCVAESADRDITVTKSGNTFTLYENGAPTTSYQNRWRRFQYHRMTAGYPFQNADTLKALQADLPDSNYNLNTNFNTNKDGILLRTFVYSDADVRIWHRYHNDNGGYIRVNGRDVQTMGGYSTPAGETAPDVYIDLKVGWNCVEIWHMDADSGGGMSLTDNTQGFNEPLSASTNRVASVRLSAHPNVLYQTSIAPFDYFNDVDGFGWTPGVNAFLGSASVYDRALSAAEVLKPYSPQLNLNSLGRVTTPLLVEEGENLWPQQDMVDTTYGVSGGPGAIRGEDDAGIYHQMTINNGGAYKGFDITSEPNVVYVFSAEVWVSAGHTMNYRAIQVEQASSNAGVDFSAIPEETWTRVSVRTWDSMGGNIRFLLYPAAGTAGQAGVLRWRNVVVRKEPAVPMKAAQNSLTVGEIIET